jgi:putative lipoic acid-binding regulatory protein
LIKPMTESKDEKLLDFPCDFPIKMMGRNQPAFRDAAVAAVEEHTGKIRNDAIRTALSRNGNFLSITITVKARNQQQLDDIYRNLTEHDEILVAL